MDTHQFIKGFRGMQSPRKHMQAMQTIVKTILNIMQHREAKIGLIKPNP